jgi:chromosome segregation protein
MGAEARLGRLGGSDLGDALAQYEALREKARGQLNVIAERRRSIERERSAFVDQEVIASLESDAARLRSDLAGVDDEAEALGPAAEALAEAEADLARSRSAFDDEWADGVPSPSGRTAEVRGELSALRKAAGRAGADAERHQARLTNLRGRLQRAEAEGAEAAEAVAAAESATPRLGAAQVATQQDRLAAEEALAAAEAARDETAAERNTWTARVDALTLALDEARQRAGAERLAGVEGVHGTLLELVDIDPGWEAAAEAACGEALAAVVVGSVDAGRRALRVLAEGDVAGAVLAVGAGPAGASGPAGAARPAPAPGLGEPVLAHVRPRNPEVGPLLDALLRDAVAIDGPWEEALDAALAHPEAVVVSRSGARFGLTGWRVVTATTGATGAALDEAQARAEAAVAAADTAAAAHRQAREAADAARKAAGLARRAVEDNERALAAAVSAAERATAQHEDVSGEIAALSEQQGESADRQARDQVRIEELAQLLPTLEAEDAELAERARAMAEARRRLDEHTEAVGLLRADLLRRRTGVDDRRSFLTRRLAEVEQRLAGSVEARRQAEARRVELDRRETALDRLSGFVGDRLREVESRLASLQERRRRETEAQRALSVELEGLRRERSAAEKKLEQVRERAGRAELDEAEVRMRLEQAVATCRRQLDLEPEAAVSAPPPELPDGMTPTVRVNELERELRVMGPINPLALEEYDALQERHQFLQDQLEDVKAGRRELNKVIRAIDEEIVRVFAAAYADVSENFEQLFETLFPGGRGRLRLTDPDDLLTCGVEVEAKPSGKNVKKLSLLSGGERSLTALAYLFAVFRSRPSPFYVMDEVEAALDDVNLHRFLDLLAEFRREAQLIVVSHQKRTMEAADLLYGVTMQPGGSSKVVSEKVGAGA